jgi:hypothetical protein
MRSFRLVIIAILTFLFLVNAASPFDRFKGMISKIEESSNLKSIQSHQSDVALALDCNSYILAKTGECIPEKPRLKAVEGLTAREIADLINRNYPGWLNTLPSCPCKVEDINASEFVRSSWLARRYQRLSSRCRI